MKFTFYERLDFKLILGLVLSLLLVGLPFLAFFNNFHQEQVIKGLKEQTTYSSRLVVSTLETAMLKEEPHILNSEIKRIAEQAGVERIMILDATGELKVSTDPSLLGKIFKNNVDPVCIVCHNHPLLVRKNTTIVKDKNGQELFRNMNLIYNRPRCYDCHSPEEPINGVLIMDLSMKDARKQIADNSRIILVMSFLMVLVTAFVLGFLVHKVILQRIKILTETTHRISSGNLDELIEFQQNDEIGKLAQSFNHMTANLQQTLNKVQENTKYLENILNGIDDEIVVVDRDFKIVTANTPYLNRCNGKKTEIIGNHCLNFSQNPPVHCDHKNCPAKAAFANGRLQKTLHTYIDTNGKDKYVEIYCSPLRDSNNQVFQVIELRRDITERKFLEEKLIQTEKLTSIGRLAAGVAHEINNPLDGILNCFDVIRRNPEDLEKRNTMIELISEGINRIAFIVRRLLTFSKNHKLHYEKTSLIAVIEKSIELIQHKLVDQGIRLEKQFKLDPIVYCDPYNVGQVFINVFINACDALEGKTNGRIRIEISESPKKSNMIFVHITDNGIGISPDDLERIFNPFFTTKDEEKGTGLGLSICKKIIEDHGGSIHLKSTPTQGTTVEVTLPANEGDLI